MKITLRKLSLPKQPDKVSLYLDITGGPKRVKEYLGIQIFKQPKTAAERAHNTNNLELANKVRIQREHDLQVSKFGFSETNYDSDFIEYFDAFVKRWDKSNYRVFEAVLQHFKDFIREKGKTRLTGQQVTVLLCEDFAEYLKKHLNYSSPYDYFKKFKQILKRARKEKVISLELDDIQVEFKFDKDAIRKPILSIDEIELMMRVEKHNRPNIARAFVFALNTGFDYKTVSTLQWKELDGNCVVFDRSKTSRQNRIELNENALLLLPDRPTSKEWKEEYIFPMPTWEACVKYIRGWAQRAGVDKKVTWHSARHSLGTMLINDFNTNIRVVQEIMGHSDIKQTMRYTRVRDSSKSDAMGKLPEMKFDKK